MRELHECQVKMVQTKRVCDSQFEIAGEAVVADRSNFLKIGECYQTALQTKWQCRDAILRPDAA